ncbi:hypothetical protein CEXT_343211 [Caerostris extrusa]|uniref:Uncharacterized protein n=1 Tax=Caerostris extrusa TaxID=172846 RepID=A0AAV4RJK4_CAEEX|nr:hypothetical protein CEXT_343211 [Caerostris extrusa]
MAPSLLKESLMKETQFFREVEKIPFSPIARNPINVLIISSSTHFHSISNPSPPQCRPPHKGPLQQASVMKRSTFFFSTSRDDVFPVEDRTPNFCFKDAPIRLRDQEGVLIGLD